MKISVKLWAQETERSHSGLDPANTEGGESIQTDTREF